MTAVGPVVVAVAADPVVAADPAVSAAMPAAVESADPAGSPATARALAGAPVAAWEDGDPGGVTGCHSQQRIYVADVHDHFGQPRCPASSA